MTSSPYPGIGTTGQTVDRKRTKQPSTRSAAFAMLLVLVAAMWVIEAVDTVLGGRLDNEGVRPLDIDGLTGILAAPLLHSGWAHLLSNTVPLLIVGGVIALSGARTWLVVTICGWLLSGAVAWLLGGTGSVHVGASGIVFAYILFVIVRGVFTRRIGHLLIGLVAAGYYGFTLLGGIVPWDNEGISWQGHLGGALGGLLAASHSGRGAKKPS